MVRKKLIKKASAKAVKPKPTVRISAMVTQTLHNKIKLFASRNNLSISDLLAAAAKEYMKRS